MFTLSFEIYFCKCRVEKVFGCEGMAVCRLIPYRCQFFYYQPFEIKRKINLLELQN